MASARRAETARVLGAYVVGDRYPAWSRLLKPPHQAERRGREAKRNTLQGKNDAAGRSIHYDSGAHGVWSVFQPGNYSVSAPDLSASRAAPVNGVARRAGEVEGFPSSSRLDDRTEMRIEVGGSGRWAAPAVASLPGAPGAWLALLPPVFGSARAPKVDCKPGPVPTPSHPESRRGSFI